MVFEPEKLINLVDKGNYTAYFLRNLFLCHKYMGIVLIKAPYTHKAVESAALFMPVYKANFCDSHRKVSV